MWLVFIYSTYYPQGGVYDFAGAFTTEELCQAELRGAYKTAPCPENFNGHYCHTDDIRFIQVYEEDTDTFKSETVSIEY